MDGPMPMVFGNTGFLPHGHCFLWTPVLLWEYVGADALIGLSYYTIPMALLYFVRRRADLQFDWIFVMFSAFIFACGTTHFLSIWTIWHPDYWLDAGVKVATAAISAATAIRLWPLIPQAIRIPTPSQFRAAIDRLEIEIAERRKAEEAVAHINHTLEQRVAERTVELETANRQLQVEIASRIRAEQIVRDSEQRFRSLVLASSELVWRTDTEGNLTWTQPDLQQYTGRSDDPQIMAKDQWEAFVHPDDLPRLTQTWQEARSTAVHWKAEFRIRRPDGDWGYVSSRAVPIMDSEGRIQEWIGLSIDITERQNARNEALKLNEQLERLIQVVQSLASARTLTSMAEIVTAAARALAIADGATLNLRDQNEMCCIAEDASVTQWVGQRFALDASASGWVILNRQPAIIADVAAGSSVPIAAYREGFVKSLITVPIRAVDPIGTIGVYWAQSHAPTEQEVQLLQTLADAAAIAMENIRYYDELEWRVTERTAQLAAVNRELETFTYSVSHDLKAPLRGIEGFSRLLLQDHSESLNEEGRGFLQHIQRGIQQMGQLIQDLLDYSRIERRALKSSKVNIKSLVQHIVDANENRARKHGAEIHIELPDAEVTADADGLAVAIRNLVDNALKFSRTKPKSEIKIGGKWEEDRFVFWVRDNGIGIDMKFHERIFEIFQRLHRAEDYPGTGIGLAMVRKAMQRIGGNVRVDSQPGTGSTFYLEIPR